MQMIQEIRHVGIVVQDLKKVSDFFINDLGFKLYKKTCEDRDFIDKILKLKKTKLVTFKLKLPNGHLVELLKFKNYPHKLKWQGKIFHTGITHIALTLKNINTAFLKLKKKYKFNSSPIISKDGKAIVAFFYGPENIIIELVEVL
jgi:catechol 2,3-dioxygenase-like lactoylglutathione lyase family enzyme